MRAAVQVCPEKDVLYGELAHKGISQGLFIPFTHVGEKHDAFGGRNGWLTGKEVD